MEMKKVYERAERRLKELVHGKKTYLPKKKKEKKYKLKLNETELSAHYKKPYLDAEISETNLKVLRPNLYKDKKGKK